MGINIGQVVVDINKKTDSFKGMQVPVKVIIDTSSKEYEIEVGTPPASSLIKKEAGIQKGSGNPKVDFVADIKIEQVIKVAQMKEGNLLGKSPKERVKEIMGTCSSMGIMVEGTTVEESIKRVNNGEFDEKIASGKTELTAEEIKEQEEEKKRMAEELKDKREDFIKAGKEIMNNLKNKGSKTIRTTMKEEGIPEEIIKELVPTEDKPEEGKEAAAPEEAKKE